MHLGVVAFLCSKFHLEHVEFTGLWEAGVPEELIISTADFGDGSEYMHRWTLEKSTVNLIGNRCWPYLGMLLILIRNHKSGRLAYLLRKTRGFVVISDTCAACC
jgi:hypothetical protein